MDYKEYFDFQRAALIDEYKNRMSTCLIATTLENIKMHARSFGWQICYLESSKSKSVIIIQKAEQLFPELWVSKSYGGYRKAFTDYLQNFHGFIENSIPQEWQVDHLLPKSRFQKGHSNYFIRLYLLERSVNASFGAGFEKMLYKNERENIPHGGFHMDWIAFLKAYGQKLPSKSSGQGHWASWAWKLCEKLEKEGVDDKILAYVGISSVLNLGFTGRYCPLPLQDGFRTEALNSPTINCTPELKTL